MARYILMPEQAHELVSRASHGAPMRLTHDAIEGAMLDGRQITLFVDEAGFALRKNGVTFHIGFDMEDVLGYLKEHGIREAAS